MPAVRPGRVRPTNTNILLHRAAVAIARALLRRRPRADASDSRGRPKIVFILMHAWGMGGTIRTTLTVAGYLARRHDVEILSVVRRRNVPFFTFPPGVVVTAIDDQRPSPSPRWREVARKLLRMAPSVLLYPGDRARRVCSLWTDVMALRKLWGMRAGVLVGTRPALNMLVADARREDVIVVGWEHMNFRSHTAWQRPEIASRYRDLEAVVALTEEDRREYRALLPERTRVVRMPNAVAEAANGEGPSHTKHVVLAAGRLTYQKGFDRLVRAFAAVSPELPDWTLRICGRGPQREKLEGLIADYGLLGKAVVTKPARDLQSEMSTASLFVLSSRFEGLPMVLLEAMSNGIPVVSFDCPTGPRDVIEHGEDGLLVPEGDVNALAAAMADLMKDEAKRARYGAAAARKAAAAYTIDVVGAEWEKMLESLAHAR